MCHEMCGSVTLGDAQGAELELLLNLDIDIVKINPTLYFTTYYKRSIFS